MHCSPRRSRTARRRRTVPGTPASSHRRASRLLPFAAYPITVWAGARAALARAILAPRDDELGDAAGRGDPVPGPAGRRVRGRTPAHRARPARRRAAAAGRADHDARAGPAGAAARLAGREAPGRRAGAGRARPRRAARADPRRAPAGADRPRPRRAVARAGRPLAGAGPGRHRAAPPAAAERRGDRVLRGREALANVAKHSGATPASVYGRLVVDRLVLEIRDDGARRRRPAAGAPGWPAWPTGSPPSAAGCVLSSPPGGPPCCAWSCRAAGLG